MTNAPSATEPTTTPAGRTLPWWLPSVLTVVTLGAVWQLRARATAECDIGINAGVAMVGPTLVLAAAALALPVVLEPVRRLLPGAVALPVVLLLLWAGAFLLLDHLGAPEGYPSSSATCSDNVPSWWPAWLPS